MQLRSTRLILSSVTYDKAADVFEMDADNNCAVTLAHHERSKSILHCSKSAITHSLNI